MVKPKRKKERTAEVKTNIDLPRVVIDTCVFISAKISKDITSSPVEILKKWREGYFIVMISDDILEELVRILTEKHICTEDEIIELVAEIVVKCRLLESWETDCFDKADKGDNILAAAIYQGKANYLVTTDKNILNLKHYRKTTIISPNKFLEELEIDKKLKCAKI